MKQRLYSTLLPSVSNIQACGVTTREDRHLSLRSALNFVFLGCRLRTWHCSLLPLSLNSTIITISQHKHSFELGHSHQATCGCWLCCSYSTNVPALAKFLARGSEASRHTLYKLGSVHLFTNSYYYVQVEFPRTLRTRRSRPIRPKHLPPDLRNSKLEARNFKISNLNSHHPVSSIY